jgi:hypothetical protein
MEHAEAHERLSDLALEPRRLAAFAADPGSETEELRAHVASCEQCATDLAGWQRTWAELGHVTRAGTEPAVEPPPHLRARVLAALGGAAPTPARDPVSAVVVPIAAGDQAPRPEFVRRRAWRPWTLAAAAMLVAVLAVGNSYLRTAELDRLHAETTQLALAAATLDRVLAAEPNWTVTLRTADGTPGGTLAWSATEVVVLTSGLPAPGPGQAYRCWLERAGSRTAMGWMSFSRSTGYWAGPMSNYGNGALRPGGRFGVSLVPTGGSGTPVLVGEL